MSFQEGILDHVGAVREPPLSLLNVILSRSEAEAKKLVVPTAEFVLTKNEILRRFAPQNDINPSAL